MFGTFNSSELSIIWGGNQFTEVQYLVERIRSLTFMSPYFNEPIPVFTSSHTIIAYNSDGIADEWNHSLAGSAKIFLSSSTTRTVDKQGNNKSAIEYLESLKEKAEKDNIKFEICECVGEYDYIIETKPPQIQLLLQSKNKKYGALHPKNKKSAQYFSASTTNLVYSQEDLDERLRNFNWNILLNIQLLPECIEEKVSDYWQKSRPIIGRITSDQKERDEVATKFEQYREIVVSDSSQPSNFCTNLDFLYSDFVHAVNNTPDWLWAKDLEKQFLTALEVLTALLKTKDDNCYIDRLYLERSEYLFTALRQQIRHVAEAGKFSLDAASLLSESTSQFDLLFHMYYGAVKDILACLYDREGGDSSTKQSTLIPLIQFQPTSIVKSELFFEVENIENKIVNITVPYDGWGEPVISVLSLIHELYHYAAPTDRRQRNELFAKIIVTELIANAIELMLQDMYQRNLYELKAKYEYEPYRESILRIAVVVREALICIFDRITVSDYISNDRKSPVWDDMSWTRFQKNLDDWCIAVDGYGDEEGNFGSFLSKYLPEIYEKVKATFENTTVKIDQEIFALLKTELSTKEDEEGQTYFIDYIREADKTWIVYITGQMRELFPDYAMTQLSDMKLCEYLLVFAALQEKLHNGCDVETDKALPLRVGYVIHLLLNSGSDLAEENVKRFIQFEQEFVRIYTAYSKRFCQIEQHNVEKMNAKGQAWFEIFKNLLTNYYAQYGQYQGWFNKLSAEQFQPICNSRHKARLANSSKQLFEILQKEDEENSLFANNIKAVWSYQQQQFLCELQPLNTRDIVFATETNTAPVLSQKHNTVIMLQIDDILKQIHSVADRLEHTHKEKFGTSIPQHGIWFRGSQNASFEIIPSIMVHYLDKDNRNSSAAKGVSVNGYLWQYQRNLFEHFKYQADGANEFINGVSYTVPDYLAIMQHYEKYTCYLDWSEDAFKSLFFALEDYVEDKKKQWEAADAALYMMDPMLYNRARTMIIEKHLKDCAQEETERASLSKMLIWLKRQNKKLIREQIGYIPNLSIQYNYEKYPMFSLSKAVSFDKPAWNASQDQETHAETDNQVPNTCHEITCSSANATVDMVPDEIFNLPIAIHLSRLSPRIRTQNGQFVAFSPFALPVYGKTPDEDGNLVDEIDIKDIESNRYAYLSLRKIQDYFLKAFPGENPFLYELHIKEDIKKSIGEQLRKAGSNRYNIYPELDNLKL